MYHVLEGSQERERAKAEDEDEDEDEDEEKEEEEEEWQHAEERTLSVEGTARDVCLFASPILRTNQRWRPTKEYHSTSRGSLTLRNGTPPTKFT
ncbi:hypothetical protein HZH68_009313 [Vespula germanica]|uniref:Uncharacterized protein n=1 Tax=Vespula germanica TaxID=30212 RepID=A0A834JV65_VESGE|nr:hypothetical protein HZH68_009313 [Vespula germanica]